MLGVVDVLGTVDVLGVVDVLGAVDVLGVVDTLGAVDVLGVVDTLGVDVTGVVVVPEPPGVTDGASPPALSSFGGLTGSAASGTGSVSS